MSLPVWGEFHALRLFGFVLSCVPRTWDAVLFYCLWPLFRVRKHQEIRRVATHLAQSKLSYLPTSKQVYWSLFQNGLDSLRALHGRRSMAQRVHIENASLLEGLLQAKRPVVIVSIHTGAFELLHHSLTHFGRPVQLVTSYQPSLGRERYLRHLRSTPHTRILFPAEASTALRTLLRHGEMLALMVDQSREGKGTPCQFLGRTNTLWLRLPCQANKAGAYLLTYRALRNGDQHILRFGTVYEPSTPIEFLSERLAEEFSTWVRECPEQWCWNYLKLWQH